MTIWATGGWYMRAQGWKAQTRREIADEMAWRPPGRWTHRLIPELTTWLDRKLGQVGFYLAQALSGHGCFNAYLKCFKKRDDESCSSLNRYGCLSSHSSPWCWRRWSSMGVQSAATTGASRNPIRACTRGLASSVDLAVRVVQGRNRFIPRPGRRG